MSTREINRRSFIKHTTAAGIGLSVLSFPNILTGKDDRKVRIGLIGVGLRGRNHLNVLLQRSDTEIIAICDVDEDALNKSQEIISKMGKKKAREYTGSEVAYLKLLESDDIDGGNYRYPLALAYKNGRRHHEGWQICRCRGLRGQHARRMLGFS